MKVMPTDPDKVLSDIEERARREYLPIISGEKGDFLEGLARKKSPCNIVEIGVMVGYLTIRIARNMGEGCSLTGVEISAELAARATANLEEAGLLDRVKLVRGDAREAISGIEGEVDFAVFDGEKSQYMNYMRQLQGKLKLGAVIAAYIPADAHDKAVRYLEFLDESPDFRTEQHVFGEEVWVVSEYSSAKG